MTLVVDSSVILAAMLDERSGGALYEPGQLLNLSVVNLAEVHTDLVERGSSVEDVNSFFPRLPLRIRAFRDVDAERTGRLRAVTRHLGLSLGDRACLSLAKLTNLPVLTADQRWAELDIGVEVRLIRERS
ncbi:MAG: hypothetical protein AVDCRST_MAG39-1487 [uncultured Sphingomonadaceae bacterium]|uniref:PIN domain-containing protein n=1 Tax=uncultured Sphingomonadaceae bacterium TaxID=169976 RepID=A0A6J4SR11_9SPHN|nr:MAG: hypothetical protein AVDCRST_MAG39-1487 [uncultured Sphingomonadaceae bacterium]